MTRNYWTQRLVTSTTLTRVHFRRRKHPVKSHCPLNLDSRRPPYRFGSSNHNVPTIVFDPIVNDVNRRLAIHPVMLGKQEPNHAVSGHLASALRNTHQYTRSPPPFVRETPRLYPSRPCCTRAPPVYGSRLMKQRLVNASNMPHPPQPRTPCWIHRLLKCLRLRHFQKTRCNGHEEGDPRSILRSSRCSSLRRVADNSSRTLLTQRASATCIATNSKKIKHTQAWKQISKFWCKLGSTFLSCSSKMVRTTWLRFFNKATYRLKNFICVTSSSLLTLMSLLHRGPKWNWKRFPTTGMEEVWSFDSIARNRNGEPWGSKHRKHPVIVHSHWRPMHMHLVPDCRDLALNVLRGTSFTKQCIHGIFPTEQEVVPCNSSPMVIMYTKKSIDAMHASITVFNENCKPLNDAAFELKFTPMSPFAPNKGTYIHLGCCISQPLPCWAHGNSDPRQHRRTPMFHNGTMSDGHPTWKTVLHLHYKFEGRTA